MGIRDFFSQIFGQNNEQTLDEKLRAELQVAQSVTPANTPAFTVPDDYSGPVANVFLEDTGEMKIAVVKILRGVLGLSLIDAKQGADRAPGYVAYDIPVFQAEHLCRELEKVGASARIEMD